MNEGWTIPTLREAMDYSTEPDYWRRLTDIARSEPERGERVDVEDAFEYWCKWLVARIAKKYDAVVLITADEGFGKSTLALRMALRCAELQGLAWRPQEVCFSALDLISAYRRITKGKLRGWPVWYDEGVRGTQAGEQMLPEQRAIIKALALVRESGAILFALYPSVWLAAKQIRARRACLWIHIVHRGLGRVHERDRRLNYLPTDALGLSISPKAPHLVFAPFDEDDPAWREYLTTKTEKLGEVLQEMEEDMGGGVDLRSGKFEGKFLRIGPLGDKTFSVRNAKGADLGRVVWYQPWKKYVFEPNEGIILDTICSSELARFLKFVPATEAGERPETKADRERAQAKMRQRRRRARLRNDESGREASGSLTQREVD